MIELWSKLLVELYKVMEDTNCYVNVYITDKDQDGTAYYKIDTNNDVYIGQIYRDNGDYVTKGEMPHE